MTTVSQASQAGDREIQVASNAGWSAGAYALISTPSGPVTRRVGAIGSLIFDAPVPVALPVGTLIQRIEAPQGDTTAPVVSLSGAATLSVGATATVQFTCDDGSGVGVEACNGSVAVGSAIDTSTPGIRNVTVTAWDRNGNTATQTLTYTVSAATPTTSTPPTSAPPAATPAAVAGTATSTGTPSPAAAVNGATATAAGSSVTSAGSTSGQGLALTGSAARTLFLLGLALVGGGMIAFGRTPPPHSLRLNSVHLDPQKV